jgi:hypothetical protein
MHKITILSAVTAALLLGEPAAWAQGSGTSGVVVTSVPGKAMISETVELVASIAAIDKGTRTITLRGPKGTADVVAGPEVRNFDQLKVGDNVVTRFQRALSMELKKTRRPLDQVQVEATTRAEPGARPAAATSRTMTVLADVVAVDPEQSIISLKGPHGQIVDLTVRNPEHFKVVHVGDQVEAVYMEAVALTVEPVPAR